MNLKASAVYRPVDISRVVAKLVPRLTVAAEESTALVTEAAIAYAPERTGELKGSFVSTVTWQGTKVTGEVENTSDHAAFVEFGTGVRGAASEGAGDGPYNPDWPGMEAQPYLRPALDENQGAIRSLFDKAVRGL